MKSIIFAVKTALRISNNAFDDEIEALVDAATIDLTHADVTRATADDDLNPLIRRAIITYCRLNFGEPSDYDRLKRAYDEIKHQLSMNSDYTDFSKVNE